MKWWKAHHGIATDRKYAVLLRHIRSITERNALRVTDNTAGACCNIKRSDILAVWVWLIDFSSQNTPRGSVNGAPTDEIATSLDLEDSDVDLILESFRWRGMISDNSLTAFEKRQPPDDPTNAIRQKRHREKKKNSNALLPVTLLRNENSLSREDGDGDGDGEVLVVNDLLPATEVLSDRRDGEGNSPTNQPTDNQRFEFMKSALAGYMHPAKPPDAEIVRKCLVAINGADMKTVGEFLRDRYVNREQSPRHANGPRKYGWFVTVLTERFRGHA